MFTEQMKYGDKIKSRDIFNDFSKLEHSVTIKKVVKLI